jgi:hypothetical protein
MNLFRSEEHVRNWSGFKANTDEGIVQLPEMVGLFSGNLFTRRLDPDYISRFKEYIGETLTVLTEIGKTRPFWSPPTE